MNVIETTSDLHRQATAAARANCCKLIAACFYPPDTKLFGEEKIGEKLTMNLKTTCPEALPLAPRIKNHLDGEDSIALSVAYTRLFLGPPEALAPPYASFYLDQNRNVMGPSSLAIMKVYDKAGLRMDETFNEMPDHIAVMLEFLCYLFSREAVACNDNDVEALEEIPRTITSFGGDYLMSWIPRFCGLITAAGQNPFYTDLAKTLEAFLQSALRMDRRMARHPSI